MLKTVEKVLLLQELEVFRNATSEQLARLAIISDERRFKEKEVIFEQGDSCDSLLLLVDGLIQLGPPGRAVVESTLLDPLSFFSGRTHQTSAIAVNAGTLLATPRQDLADLLSSEGEFGWIVLEEIADIGSQLMRQRTLEPA